MTKRSDKLIESGQGHCHKRFPAGNGSVDSVWRVHAEYSTEASSSDGKNEDRVRRLLASLLAGHLAQAPPGVPGGRKKSALQQVVGVVDVESQAGPAGVKAGLLGSPLLQRDNCKRGGK